MNIELVNVEDIDVSTLKNCDLDYWVAREQGKEAYIHNGLCFLNASYRDWRDNPSGRYSPSTDWTLGGPIIDSNDIELTGTRGYPKQAQVYHGRHDWSDAEGETNLIAAMRCYLKFKIATRNVKV